MATPKDSLKQTILVALIMCVVFSIIVSSAAVILKPKQEANRVLDRNKNVLGAAGLYKDGMSADEVNTLFARFDVKLLDIATAKYLTDEQMKAAGISAATYDQRAAAKDPALSKALPAAQDIALIRRQADYATVYVMRDESGKVDRVVLPIHGYGLWSTMYGFIAIKGDANTILGLSFYDQGETPGLGGEVENPLWKAKWPGVKLFDSAGKLIIAVSSREKGPSVIDGLSGATLTTRGVDHLVKYWMGEYGFGPYLTRLKAGEE
ncbi:Na+-transporting NADH:ubiquinone oxidoreductase subunit C [Sinobacterium caligoides]|uniref:Na(+)-translocating NADH-quinone reductase subunit C n=1 Tax=Sinobacterium caligoides TaxID=933926 RepID=A0A3N2DKU2_9GAMM|nr:Na(+)-translocating NADH-quinone reductase subunit C [Sinobacterium caligoides]ROS00299.1 Na+-transporting NADH:ubiquinone oxidoreductase subunit C [Sinobacterium caligoides]